MALPPRSDPSDWSAEIADEAERHMKARVAVYESRSVGGARPTLTKLFESKARVQHLRAPTETAQSEEWSTKTAFTIQIPLRVYPGLIRKGLTLRVLDGDKDKALEQIAMTVQRAINSSDAAVRTIVATSELAAVPAVTP